MYSRFTALMSAGMSWFVSSCGGTRSAPFLRTCRPDRSPLRRAFSFGAMIDPRQSGELGDPMSTIHLHQTTTATPEQFIAGLTDFGPGRAKLFGNSTDDYLKVHS